MCEICSKLIIETPERCDRLRSSVLIVNLTYFTYFSGVTIAEFEQENADWGGNFGRMCLDRTSLFLVFQL